MDNDLVLEGWPFNKKNDDRISMDEVNKIILERLEDICKKYNKPFTLSHLRKLSYVNF